MVNLLTAGSWDSLPGIMGIGALGLIVVFLFAIVVVILKGYALWHAAKRDEKWWFIAILIINTVGILELVYLIFFVKKWPKIYSGKKASSPSSTDSTPSSTPSSTPV